VAERHLRLLAASHREPHHHGAWTSPRYINYATGFWAAAAAAAAVLIRGGRRAGAPQMDRLVKMLENADTNGVTPLAECIAAVGKQMHAETRSLLGTKKKAYLVIVTDGLPSDKYGKPCAVSGVTRAGAV